MNPHSSGHLSTYPQQTQPATGISMEISDVEAAVKDGLDALHLLQIKLAPLLRAVGPEPANVTNDKLQAISLRAPYTERMHDLAQMARALASAIVNLDIRVDV